MKNERWPKEDVRRLLEMRKLRWRLPSIATALNRSPFAVDCKIRYLKMNADQRETRRMGIQRRRHGKIGSPSAPINRVSEISRPDPAVLAARDHRFTLKHRTLTSLLCGDPLPGMSALDRKEMLS